MTPVITLLHVFPTFRPGGAELRTVALINGLGPSFRHKVVSLDGLTSAAERVAPGVDFELVQGLRRANPLRVALDTARLLRRLSPDVVATYNWGAIEAAAGCAFAGFTRLIHTEDGFGREEAEKRLARRRWFRRAVLRRALRVVVPSRTLEKIVLEEFRVPRAKVTFIPNSADTERFRPAGNRGALRRALGFAGDDLLIGSVGHLRPEKNYELLLDAFAMLEPGSARLVLAGDGTCRADLERKASELGLSGRVRFLGAVSEPERVYQALDVFVLSSHTEQMPLSLLEAMASSLPAVCTNVGDCATMLATDNPAVIVPPGDPATLAAALREMAADPALRSRLGAANHARALSEYSLETMIERYRALYLEAAGTS